MNDKQPLVSVIVPIYNVEKYFRRCVDSILKQDYPNIEIWLVDDGSPDGCPAICDEYAQRDKRIKVIHKPNGGLSDARNAAINLAKGEFITFIDSDDYVTQDYVSTLYSLIDRYKAQISIAMWHIFPEGDMPNMPEVTVNEHLMDRNTALSNMFYQKGYDVSACVKMYHRSLFDSIRYPKGQLFEDLQTTFKLMLKCNRVVFTNKPVYFYMFRKGSIEGAPFSEKKMDSALEVFNLMRSYESQLQPVKDALRRKLVTFSFHLLLKMPMAYMGGGILQRYIKESRLSVILDNRTPLKSKIACIATYFGFDFVRWLFHFIDRRRE